MNKNILIYCLLCLLPLSGNAYSETNDHHLIEALNQKYSQLYLSQDFNELIGLYTNDASLLPDSIDIYRGKPAIKAYYLDSVLEWKPAEHVTILEHLVIAGALAFGYGRFKGVFRNDTEEITLEGTAVMAFKKSGGNWQYYIDSWNVLKTY